MPVRVEVRQSGLWQLNSVAVGKDGACFVVDPAYFPAEIGAFAAEAAQVGRVQAVVLTHGHWDHVVGWPAFPDAKVLASPRLRADVAAGAPAARKNLSDAADFDGRWYVPRPAPLAWPEGISSLADGERLALGGADVQALLLPGHSADGLGLLVPEAKLLIAGDHLSPCEIPFVEDAQAYRATLEKLAAVLPRVEEIVPGHGPRLSREAAQRLLDEDRRYLDALVAARDPFAALAVALPRAAEVPGMKEHHAENCRARFAPGPPG